MRLSLILAVARNGVIGRDRAIPWRIATDMRRFRSLTMGKPMIMGRKTFESLPGLLPGRRHIVLTRGDWRAEGAEVVRDVERALALSGDDATVIGGAEIFALFEPLADRWELTEVHDDAEGDVTMRPPDPASWHEIARDDEGGYSFVTFERVRT